MVYAYTLLILVQSVLVAYICNLGMLLLGVYTCNSFGREAWLEDWQLFTALLLKIFANKVQWGLQLQIDSNQMSADNIVQIIYAYNPAFPPEKEILVYK